MVDGEMLDPGGCAAVYVELHHRVPVRKAGLGGEALLCRFGLFELLDAEWTGGGGLPEGVGEAVLVCGVACWEWE